MKKTYILFLSVLFFFGCERRSIDDGSDDDNGGGTDPVNCISSEKCIQRITEGSEYTLFYTNHPIESNSSELANLRNVVVVIHGLDYDAEDQFDAMKSALQSAGKYNETLLISMLYAKESIAADGQMFWTSASWRSGYNSSSSVQMSSFTILDELIEDMVLPNCPNIDNILVSGHSAGGQFSGRYATLGDAESFATTVNYIVSNPSSYTYINDKRWNAGSQTFTVPTNTCSGNYDNYYYGIQNIDNQYNPSLTVAQIQTNVPTKNVIYLLGSADNDNSDNSCEANLEGGSRYDRGTKMYDFMEAEYPGNNHSKVIVNGVGHDHTAMYNSPECVQLLSDILD